MEPTNEPIPLARVAAVADQLRAALQAVVIGQVDPIDELLVAWLAGGHVLLEGVPGVAKTLLAKAMAAALGLHFGRIQFTPDLMPADVTGGNLFDFQQRSFTLQKGPIFCQVLLGDEINRAPPKTQAALLEAMQERQVTIDGTTHPLDAGFFVIATQNPVEHEGTYPLPEAQLDRFLLKVRVDYPEAASELEVYRRSLGGGSGLGEASLPSAPVVDAATLMSLRAALTQVHVEDAVLRYLHALVSATRRAPALSCGASPRAGIALLAAARAWAAVEGRNFVLPDDLKRMARPVLSHRLLVTAEAELDGLDAGAVLSGILDQVEVPR